MRVVRLLSVSESGGYAVPPPMPMLMMRADGAQAVAKTEIDPGEQKLQVSVVDELRASIGDAQERAAADVVRAAPIFAFDTTS